MQPTLIEAANGHKVWYLNGKYHRIDGPAVEFRDGTKIWLLDGKYHRTDGPAIEWGDGRKVWYLHDKVLPFDEWLNENTYLTDGEKVMMKLKYD
jgi:hypothetical protein